MSGTSDKDYQGSARRPRPLRAHDPAVVLAALQDDRVLRSATLHDLVSVLTTARGRTFGMGTSAGRSAEEQPVHALVVLAAARVLLDQLGRQRWDWTRDALTLGAQVPDVAQVLGLDDVEVRMGLSSWSWREQDAGRMDDAERVAVLGLVREIGNAP